MKKIFIQKQPVLLELTINSGENNFLSNKKLPQISNGSNHILSSPIFVEELSAVIRAGTKAVKSGVTVGKSMTQRIDGLKQKTLKTNVAGRTGAYVDSILDKSKP